MTFEHDESEGWVWRTAYGKRIHLCNMSDLHIKDCIKYYVRIAKECTKSRVTPPSVLLHTIDILNTEKKKKKNNHRIKIMNEERTWLEILPTLTDTELRVEYSYLFGEGGKYHSYPLSRDRLIKKI